MTLPELEDEINKVAKDTMEKTFKRRIRQDNEEEPEPIWFNTNIRKEISVRRQYNKSRRKATTEEEKKKYKELYCEQKIKIKEMVKAAIYENERNMTDKILKDPNRSKKLWEYIDKLKGKETKSKDTTIIYDEEGNQLEQEKIPNLIKKFWTNIYQKHPNELEDIWNDTTKKSYEKNLEELRKNKQIGVSVPGQDQQVCKFPIQIKEHIDMYLKVTEKNYLPMEKQVIKREEVIKQLK